jgi:hypothetical protein
MQLMISTPSVHQYVASCHDSLLYRGSEDDDELGLEVTG